MERYRGARNIMPDLTVKIKWDDPLGNEYYVNSAHIKEAIDKHFDDKNEPVKIDCEVIDISSSYHREMKELEVFKEEVRLCHTTN